MQTAVNAFAIFLYGSLDDIERLPADYVLRSVSKTLDIYLSWLIKHLFYKSKSH